MPEIKNVFRQGVMNKDDDERIIPNGQYRDAMNIEISTSEDSDVGTVQNILGNTRVDDLSLLDGTRIKAIGSIADEKNDRLYWFVTGFDVNNNELDAIIEYTNDGVVTPVFVDRTQSILKFSKSTVVTGINIIDNLLFWTDNINEPRKINIDNCKIGTSDFNTTTKLIVNGVDKGEIKEENITVIKKRPTKAPDVRFVETTFQPLFSVTGLDLFQKYPEDTLSNIDIANSSFQQNDILILSRSETPGQLPQNYELKVLVTSVSGTTYELKIIELTSSSDYIENNPLDFDVIKFVDQDAIFEKEFVRFATRYKYIDGEFSAYSPFTQPVFVSGRFGFHPTKDPYNLGMENKLLNVMLTNLVQADAPKDIVQIDILFKTERSTTIYSIDSIKPNDPTGYWEQNDTISNGQIIGWTGLTVSGTGSLNAGEFSTGQYEITVENIYAALPENQLLRPYDNVPKRALAQEITGNRLVYANYFQNYDLVDDSGAPVVPDIIVEKEDRALYFGDTVGFSENIGLKSIKSLRKYYLGVVYGDEYGRETPVLTNKGAAINIPYTEDVTNNIFNPARSLRLKANLQGNQPNWATYYKFYLKQTTGEYYNLTLDRVYKAQEDENLYVSFPSSDRNKIQEGDYLILKKQVDIESVVPVEEKIKIIDIKNEAPESIRFNFVSLGTGGGSAADNTALFPDINQHPSPGAAKLLIDAEAWINAEGGIDLDEGVTPSDKLAVQFSITNGGVEINSKKYFVSSYASIDSIGTDGSYQLLLRDVIDDEDAWVESSLGVLNSDAAFRITIFKLQEKDVTEFEGRFFVKIISNPVTQQYLIPSISDVENFRVLGKADTFVLADHQATGISGGGNFFGIHNTSNSSWTHTTNYASNFLSASEQDWSNITSFGTGAADQGGWFIDAAHFEAAQEEGANIDASRSGKMTKGNVLAGNASTTPAQRHRQYVNGLPGIITPDHTTGPYRLVGGQAHGAKHWSSVVARFKDNFKGDNGIVNTSQSFYNNGGAYQSSFTSDGTYVSSPSGGHYMHFSVTGFGEDLHNGNWDATPLYGSSVNIATVGGNLTSVFNQIKDNLQKIYCTDIYMLSGPGVTNGLFQLGNTLSTLDNSGGSNRYSYIGFGNTNFNSLSQEEQDNANNCFNPAWKNPYNASVVSNLVAGNRFEIESDPGEIYTIINVHKKLLYNHTSWDLSANISDGLSLVEPDSGTFYSQGSNSNSNQLSVARAFSNFYNQAFADAQDGITSISTDLQTAYDELTETITNFGKANNRRVCYILELDKSPVNSANWNSSLGSITDSTTSLQIRFVDNFLEEGQNTLPTSPAIFETEAKEETDLNIYFEASDAIPLKVNSEETYGEMLAPVGTKVVCSLPGSDDSDYNQITDDAVASSSIPNGYEIFLKVLKWEGNILTLTSPGLKYTLAVSFQGYSEFDYVGKTLRFCRKDGSYTQAKIKEIIIPPAGSDTFTQLIIEEDVHKQFTGLPYYNCFSFGNGVESNRIRDDFNESFILNGVRASAVLEEPYEEEHRKYGLIHSGLYNSTSGVNNLNQFIQAEKITKDVNPTFGSIQKLYSRTKDLVTLCEDKVLQIFVDRDLLFNAEGQPQLLTSDRFLGTTQPFRGNYGISKNPESFAAESFRAYFTDKQRGAVLRLSIDGLTPISDAGMHDFFRDNLKDGGRLYGSYDAYKEDYNLSIYYASDENEVLNSEFNESLVTQVNFGANKIINDDFTSTTTGLTNNLLSLDNSDFEPANNWTVTAPSGNNPQVFYSAPDFDEPGENSLLLYNSSTTTTKNNSKIELDITSLNIGDTDVLEISFLTRTNSSEARDFLFPGTFQGPVTSANELFDDLKITLHNDQGSAGVIVTSADILGAFAGTSYNNNIYTFQKTMDVSNANSANANKLRIISKTLFPTKHLYIDKIFIRKQVTNTDNWTLSGGPTSGAVNNNGVISIPDGHSISQDQSNVQGFFIEANKQYRITSDIQAVSGNPKVSFISGTESVLLGALTVDHVFSSNSNVITISVVDGDVNINSIQVQELSPFGGSVANWDLNNGGFPDRLFTSQDSDGSVVFNEAFSTSTNEMYLHQNLTPTNNILDFNEGIKCNVSFNISNYPATLSGGQANGFIRFRLYNSDGQGFEQDITSGNGNYNISGVIGSSETTDTTLFSKFGFYVPLVGQNVFSGAIDSVFLSIDAEGAGKTITFNEKSKGWTSFKSFVPELGISSVNQYYTFNNGQLWKHHTNEIRNTFYGIGPAEDSSAESSITPVLNLQPELVKHFNTLNYEGTQSKVDALISVPSDILPSSSIAIGPNKIETLSVTAIPAVNNTQLDFVQSPPLGTDSIIITDLQGQEQNSVPVVDQVLLEILPLPPNIIFQNQNIDPISYRLSFNFRTLDINSGSHVFFSYAQDGNTTPIQSSQLSPDGKVFIDFVSNINTPISSQAELLIQHPFNQDGYEENVSIEITDIKLQVLEVFNQNDNEFYNLQEDKGWYVSDIHTNKQQGLLNEFIEKEGKWYNYIKGTENHVDPAAFNFQGLGIVKTVQGED
jgi:hypothetical protein